MITKTLMLVCGMTGMALAAALGDASAKCPVGTAVVTGSLDLPREMSRVAVSVFLDNQVSSQLVSLEPPGVTFEVSVRYSTLVRGPILFFGHDCSRKPSAVEFVVTDGEQLILRRRMSRKEFSLFPIGHSRDLHIDLGLISFR